MIVIRSRFEVIGESKGLTFKSPSRTCQQFKEEADINVLVQRYANTGVFYDPVVMAKVSARPQFDDFTIVPDDYQQAQNLIVQAREAFEALPSKVRARFANNPMELLEFVSNVDNKEEAIKLGLIKVETKVETEVKPPAKQAAQENS